MHHSFYKKKNFHISNDNNRNAFPQKQCVIICHRNDGAILKIERHEGVNRTFKFFSAPVRGSFSVRLMAPHGRHREVTAFLSGQPRTQLAFYQSLKMHLRKQARDLLHYSLTGF